MLVKTEISHLLEFGQSVDNTVPEPHGFGWRTVHELSLHLHAGFLNSKQRKTLQQHQQPPFLCC